ncbi:MAG: ABC transporter ATP-binding protein [Chloroflexi bacterium]|nr:ABC transporter ATP-binding protein [Chloroflexota bacterium]
MRERVRASRFVRVLLWLAPFLRPDRRRLLAVAATTLLLTITETTTPVIIGIFVDVMLDAAHDSRSAGMNGHWLLLVLLAVMALARGFLVARQQAQIGDLGEGVAARIRTRLWGHLQDVPLDYVHRCGPGRLSLRFISDTRMLQRLIAQGMVQLAQDMLLLGAILAALMIINWRMTLGVALVMPVYLVLFYRLNPSLRHASRAARRSRSRLAAYLHDRLEGMVVIKTYVRQMAEERRLKRLARRLARNGARRASQSGALQGLAAGVVALSSVIVLALATLEVSSGRITAGGLVLFYTMLGLIIPIFQRIALANRIFQESYISLERLQQTMNVASERPVRDTRPRLRVSDGEVMVEGVTCRRSERGTVLRNVTLHARRGELIAITGPNGAGKSTLLELILGLRQPSTGRICIDGQSIGEVALDSLRAAIGFVPQDAPLLDGAIAENILYGVRSGIPEEQIQRAAELTGVDQLVARLPNGWQTRVGPGGGNLSGGQRQMVALARALAADPPILLLDEAASALDAGAEEQLARTLRQIAQQRTVIVSAHRPATLHLADRIYVLERGRVVEVGSHTDLFATNGVYARLFRAGST